METRSYAYYRDALAGRRLPQAFIDIDLLDANVADIASQAGDKLIRVASKSVRVPEVMRRVLAASPVYQGLMCYSAREAAFLSAQGFDNLLMGYPAWHRMDILPLAEELLKGKDIIFMADKPGHIAQLGAIGRELGTAIPVCIDLDMSSDLPGLHFGVWRSSVAGAEEAVALGKVIQDEPNVRLVGLMGYEAQIAGLGDNVRGSAMMNTIVRLLKRRSVTEIAKRRSDTVDALRQMGFELRIVNGGGTGSMGTTCAESRVTEVTVGSGFYSPTLFDNYRDFRYRPAAGYAIEVVRQPRPDIYTCLGGGYIASGEAGRLKEPKPYLPIGAELIAQEGAGEVQTPIRYAGTQLALGSPVLMRHSKAGELCEHFNAVLLISNGQVVGEAPTYRGLGMAFL